MVTCRHAVSALCSERDREHDSEWMGPAGEPGEVPSRQSWPKKWRWAHLDFDFGRAADQIREWSDMLSDMFEIDAPVLQRRRQ